MPTQTVQYPIATNADRIDEGFIKHANELTAIYGHLNSLFTLRASATPPAGTLLDGEAWLDNTDSTAPVLKVWDDTNSQWRAVASDVVAGAGGRLVDMFVNYTKNCKLVIDGTSLKIAASANVTAVAYIGEAGSGEMYQITADISTDFAGQPANTYYVWLQISGTGFVLVKQTSSTSPGVATHRYVGSVSWSGTALSSLANVEEYNVAPQTPY